MNYLDPAQKCRWKSVDLPPLYHDKIARRAIKPSLQFFGIAHLLG